jgi:phosphoenolpyruvate-protein kinase (PTS system EI component)
LIRKNIRKTDSIYRYGGDEFVVLLPETSLNESNKMAEKIMKILRSNKIDAIKRSVNVSIGVSSYGISGTEGAQEFVEAADSAMYKAKESGKNKIYMMSISGYEEVSDSQKSIRPKKQKQITAEGVPCSPGVAFGRVFQYKDIMSRKLGQYYLKENEIGEELNRIHEAVAKVKKDLSYMKRQIESEISASHAAIFDVHRSVLEDESLMTEIETELKNRLINAEHVVRDVFKRWEYKFKNTPSKSVKQKSYDIADIGRRILLSLHGIESNILAHIPKNSVIFAQRLLPSDTVHLDKRKARAIVTKEGSKNSHSALLARAMGIPSVTHIDPDMDNIPEGANVIVNGNTGKVIIYPGKKLLANLKAVISKPVSNEKPTIIRRKISIDRESVTVNANIASPEDARTARHHGCDGVGLYRIEQIYMTAHVLPDEKYLVDKVKKSLRDVKDLQITIRLVDIGRDKTLPYIDIHGGEDTTLGLRGIRLLFQYPKLLETQLRTCLILSKKYRLRILVPFVTLPA